MSSIRLLPDDNGGKLQPAYQLEHGQIIMISVGGIIGAGMFVGVGDALKTAGPGVLITFIIYGLVAIAVNMFLTELHFADPSATFFVQYIEKYCGKPSGATVSWAYILCMAVGPASEVIAAGTLFKRWEPDIPLWIICFIIAVLVIIMGFMPMRTLAKVGFWASFLRIFVLLCFSFLGIAAILGLFPGAIREVGITNYTSDGGFIPHGLSGVLAASVEVVMIYGGTESIGMISEDQHSSESIPYLSYNIALRTFFLHCFAMAALIAILPWRSGNLNESAFSMALKVIHCPDIAILLFDIVVLAAIITVAVTDTHLAWRLIVNAAKDQTMPSFGSAFSKYMNLEWRLRLVIWAVLLGGVVLVAVSPGNAYIVLMQLSGVGFMIVWGMITVTHMRYRKLFMMEDTEHKYAGKKSIMVLQLYVIVSLASGFLCFLLSRIGIINI